MVPRSLPRLRIAVPCNVDWNAMVGGDRARFCGQCCQTVYNVERLRPREVADLLERHGERMPCLRLFTRPDGTVVTRSCLHWVSAGVRRVRMGFVSVAALAVGFWSNAFFLRGWLHAAPPPPTVTKVGPTPPRPTRAARRTLPVPPYHEPPIATAGVPEPPRAPEWKRLRELRRGGRMATEAQIRDALAPVIARLQAHAGDLPRSVKVNVVVDVRASGRVRRVDMLVPPEFPPKQRKMVQDSTRRVRFPRNAEDYQTEFPIIFASE